MQTLLAELAVVQPTYLVCRDQDRLHRSSLEWELLQHQMVKAGVEDVMQWPNLQGAPIVTRLCKVYGSDCSCWSAVNDGPIFLTRRATLCRNP
jgi:hypothetical protein